MLYNKNPLAMFIGVAVIVWVLTFAQLGGTKYTEKISKIGLIGGIAVPILIFEYRLSCLLHDWWKIANRFKR